MPHIYAFPASRIVLSDLKTVLGIPYVATLALRVEIAAFSRLTVPMAWLMGAYRRDFLLLMGIPVCCFDYIYAGNDPPIFQPLFWCFL